MTLNYECIHCDFTRCYALEQFLEQPPTSKTVCNSPGNMARLTVSHASCLYAS